jgi:hypothetical protein
MKFTVDGKTIRIIMITVTVLIAIIFIIMKIRSNYKYPDATANDPATGTNPSAAKTAYSNLQLCYNEWLRTGDNAVKTSCYRSNTVSYVEALCPALTGAAPAAGSSYSSAYNTYTNTDKPAIVTAYAYFNSTPTAVAPGVTKAMITAARQADTTGAVRKYIAAACPGYYAPEDGTSDTLTAAYQTWAIGNTTRGFVASQITGANGATNIKNWLKYAGVPRYDTDGVTLLDPVSGYSGITGVTSVWDKTDANGVANWKKARDYGPGSYPVPSPGFVN